MGFSGGFNGFNGLNGFCICGSLVCPLWGPKGGGPLQGTAQGPCMAVLAWLVARGPGCYAGEGRVPARAWHKVGEEWAGRKLSGPWVSGVKDSQGVGDPDRGATRGGVCV